MSLDGTRARPSFYLERRRCGVSSDHDPAELLPELRGVDAPAKPRAVHSASVGAHTSSLSDDDRTRELLTITTTSWASHSALLRGDLDSNGEALYRASCSSRCERPARTRPSNSTLNYSAESHSLMRRASLPP